MDLKKIKTDNDLSISEIVGEVIGAVCVFVVPILMLFIGIALQP